MKIQNRAAVRLRNRVVSELGRAAGRRARRKAASAGVLRVAQAVSLRYIRTLNVERHDHRFVRQPVTFIQLAGVDEDSAVVFFDAVSFVDVAEDVQTRLDTI